MPNQSPTIAIIGRANVGKSTLFNCLLEKPVALVSPIPGITRDRIYGKCSWRGTELTLIDTGGPTGVLKEEIFLKEIQRQVKIALNEANLIFFIVNLKENLLPQDLEIANLLKKSKKPVILVGNKADNPEVREKASEPSWLKLSFGKPMPVSATNGSGTGDLLDRALEQLKIPKSVEEKKEKPIKVTFIGKPNVGKSSLLNALLGEERVIVSEIPFTTREPHDTLFTYKNHPFLLIDTAGVRKKAKIEPGIEKIGVARSIKRLTDADVALLITDVSEPLGRQDSHLAGLILEKEKGIIIIGNKWDLVPEKDIKTFNKYLSYYQKFFPYLPWAPIVFLSAKTGEKVKKILDLISEVKKEREKRIDEDELKQFLKETFKKPIVARDKKKIKKIKILSLKQVDINPPQFELLTTSVELPKALINTAEKRLREKFGFIGTPITVKVKKIKK